SYHFFFQAEDGIRDFHVTGVQTCALPIWSKRRWVELPSLRVTKSSTVSSSTHLVAMLATGFARTTTSSSGCRRGGHLVDASPGSCTAPTSASTMSAVDRKSTRLNSSHVKISYAVFCLKKQKQLE